VKDLIYLIFFDQSLDRNKVHRMSESFYPVYHHDLGANYLKLFSIRLLHKDSL